MIILSILDALARVVTAAVTIFLVGWYLYLMARALVLRKQIFLFSPIVKCRCNFEIGLTTKSLLPPREFLFTPIKPGLYESNMHSCCRRFLVSF
jgi:hypothetical protein